MITGSQKILELWRKCKINSLSLDSTNNKNKVDINLAKDFFIKELESEGYKCIGDGAYKLVFSKKNIDFVIKVFHTGSIDEKISSSFRFYKDYVHPYYFDGVMSIQQKVDIKNKNDAFFFFEKKFGKDYCEIYDINPENVGWIKEVPVIFDFVACEI